MAVTCQDVSLFL